MNGNGAPSIRRERGRTTALKQLQTPALVIRLDGVRSNVERMVELLGGRIERWRPHVKTAKIPEVLQLLLQRGVRRFKCATTREAQVLLSAATEATDLLVAMAHRGANLDRVIELGREFPLHSVSLLVEDAEHAAEIRRRDPDLGLYIDLNSGMDRTGIPRDEIDRVLACARAAGPALRGLHDYEGHVRSAEAGQRGDDCARIYDELCSIAAALIDAGHPIRELITSGTPTFVHALGFAPFERFDHQVSPGTVVYWDDNSERFGIAGFRAAATVATRVVSAPAPGRLTCDAGSKAIDAGSGSPCARVAGWPGLDVGSPSEEHLPLVVVRAPQPVPGQLLELIPAHVCPTVNLAEHAALLDAGTLRIVRVSARAHDL